ncbi:hypothetical protein [Streptomyces sp. Ncost-T10-10d]|uniref:hypothetical protein n=1 Tax=Streptomyces sp. Ncost-T10-10d TaxID=1839774 RepID=UPI00081F1893|nr:hypothetical protein [Streptomyces sp. Ncost-T10-10d]SCF84430.1 hypothetical protein GA0115254_11901 [Streptomyces sp. Ncost-T10-10d]
MGTPWALLAGQLCVNASLNWGSVSGQARWDRPPSAHRCGPRSIRGIHRTRTTPPWGPSHEKARLLASGEKVLDILPALRAAPYGDEDIAVVFAHMDFGNRAITDYFQYEDGRTTLACFALARPQNRPLSANTCGDMNDGPVLPVRTCVIHTFKHALGSLGLEGGPVPALASVTFRYFGPDQVSGETWG